MSTEIKIGGWQDVDAVVAEVGDRVTLENGDRLTRFVVDHEYDGSLYDDNAERYDLTGQEPEWRVVRIERPVKTDATPAPLDPSKVKAGDTVTVHVAASPPFDVTGTVWAAAEMLGLSVGPMDLNASNVTLLAHQPAPEPEVEWKPGTVAKITTTRTGNMLAIRRETGVTPPVVWQCIPDGSWWEDGDVTDVRPLVVIDPAAARKALEDNGWGEHEMTEILHHLRIEAS
jgi:hypothetical protein